MVAPLDSILSHDIVDIRPHLLDLEDPSETPLNFIGIVDYQAIVAQVLFGQTTIHEMDNDERSSEAGIALLAPSPPSGPLLQPSTSEKEEVEFSAHNDGVSEIEGISAPRQRSLSLGSPVVTFPARTHDEFKSSESRGGSRRRLRPSVFEVLKFNDRKFLDLVK